MASRWNGVAILSGSGNITTSGMETAIFKNRLPVTSRTIRNSAVGLLNLENGGLAVRTVFLSCLEAEL